MTASEVASKRFPEVLRGGYDPTEVDAFLLRVSEAVGNHERRLAEDAPGGRGSPSSGPTTPAAAEPVERARAEAEAIVAAAHAEARHILASARAQADALVEQYEARHRAAERRKAELVNELQEMVEDLRLAAGERTRG